MENREAMLIEADKRGLLTGEKKASFDEAVRRGLIANQASATDEQSTPKGSALDAWIEPIKAVGGGMINESAAGLMGMVELAGTGDAASAENTINKTREAMPDFSPKTEAGKKGLETLGDLMQTGVDLANVPISGLVGLAELLGGQGLDASVQAINDVKDNGLPATLGNDALESTGSPLLATAAHMAPEVIATIAGTKGAQNAIKKGLNATRKVAKGIHKANTALIDTTTGYPTNKFTAALKSEGLSFENIIDDVGNLPDGVSPKQAVTEIIKRKIASGETDGFLATRLVDDAGNIADDLVGKEAIKQGVREGDVQMIKMASPGTKKGFGKMLKIRRKVYSNERKGLDMRPSDVVGDSTLNRFSHIRKTATEARKELDNISRTKLKNTPIDADSVKANFFKEMDELDVVVDSSTLPPTVDFKGSMIAKDRTSQRVIRDVLDLLPEDKVPDALRAHKLKRQLDSMIDFRKKSSQGLTESGRKIAKSVRHSLNEAIRKVDNDYARVNDTLSSSLDAMGDFEQVLGPSIDVWSDGANKAIGQDLRGLMSNRKSRVKLENALTQLDDTARQLGGVFDDDIGDLVVFAKTLDDQFGSTARTSLGGEISSGVKRGLKGELKEGAVDAAAEFAAGKLDEARNINDPRAFQVLDALIRR